MDELTVPSYESYKDAMAVVIRLQEILFSEHVSLDKKGMSYIRKQLVCALREQTSNQICVLEKLENIEDIISAYYKNMIYDMLHNSGELEFTTLHKLIERIENAGLRSARENEI